MPRVNVYDYTPAEFGEAPDLIGWFNTDSATRYEEAADWDGHDHISVHTNSFSEHEALYLTKGGRWVLNRWSQREGTDDCYEFITPEQAKAWLVRNHDDAVIAEHFGEMEEESGPNLGGRPAVGTKVETRLPDDLLARLDERASTEGVARAEMIRRLVAAAL